MAGKEGAQGEARPRSVEAPRSEQECSTLAALAHLAFTVVSATPPTPKPAVARRTLSQTTDALPLPAAKRSRAEQEASQGESLAVLAVEAVRHLTTGISSAQARDCLKTPVSSVAATLALHSLLPAPLRRPMSMSEATGTAAASFSFASNSLVISQQPPTRAVYKRIIRPFPSVSLGSAGPHLRPRGVTNLFVEVFLVDEHRHDVLLPYLDGTRVARVTDRAGALFTKLKVVCTSQMIKGTTVPGQQETNTGRVCLLFILKEFTGQAFQTIPFIRVVSSPIEIFSHTQYLQCSTDDSDPSSTLPTCSEILPASGKVAGGTRCVILGDSFEKSSNLCVRFGNAEAVKADYHENGTLLVTTPALQRGMVPVRVSNDGQRWSDSTPPIFFTFT